MRRDGTEQLIGGSPVIAELMQEIDRIAKSDAKVLVTGESGVGKELVANAIHQRSARANRPMVAVNCAGLPETLLESELFGHVKGSFTGAYRDKQGKLEMADGGSIFLDEIGEMTLRMQGLLLRFMETGELQKVGADRVQGRVNVRVIAATNRNLRNMISEGTFREDLFYRLNVIHLHVPPLRERPEDIPVLARHFLARCAERFGLRPLREPPGMMEQLTQRSWRGNVRELENAIEGLVALSSDGEIDLSLLPGEGAAPAPTGPGPRASLKERIDAYERGLIVAALERAGGNRTHAARALGLNRGTLHSKLQKFGLAAEGEAEDPSQDAS